MIWQAASVFGQYQGDIDTAWAKLAEMNFIY